LLMSQGSFFIFFTRPISGACMLLAAAMLISSIIPGLRKLRRDIPKEETV